MSLKYFSESPEEKGRKRATGSETILGRLEEMVDMGIGR